MKYKISILFLCFFYSFVYSTVVGTDLCPIIPLPDYCQKQDMTFGLNSNTIIICDSLFQSQAYFFQKELLLHKKIAISLKNSASSSTAILLKYYKIYNISPESYSIKMSRNVVEIRAGSNVGMFNGITSFLQLVRQTEVKDFVVKVHCWNIEDAPRYSWRGLMLDESRHFFGKKKVKQILDWMAFYKLNRFHWHLTDATAWRLEIKQYPKLALIGGIGDYTDSYSPALYYTQDDIKEIVQYASERFIVVVPEIDMPGHAAAANRAYPEYSGGGSKQYPDFTFNPGKDSVYQFLTNILKETDVLFPSQMIHIGGDEVHYGNEKWATDKYVKNLMKKEKIPDLKSLENYFFRRMADSVTNMGNKVLAWDEVADSELSPSNTIVFYWRDDKPEQLQKALDKGFSIVLSPRHPMYFDYVQDTLQTYGPDYKKFSYNSIEHIYNFTKETIPVIYPDSCNILGVQANLWTEGIITEQRLNYMLFPRIAALAETAWSNTPKDFEKFKERLKGHLNLYKEDEIYYSDPFNRELTGEPIH